MHQSECDFNLEQYLTGRRGLVERGLEDRLPPEDVPPSTLHRAMRYSVLGGGKRVRPLICLAFAEASGGSCGQALDAALAIELLHSYTLVHDDLPCMDNDSFRRGQPTCHKAFGEAMAVLVGDALQALAFETASRVVAPPPYAPTQVIQELARAAGSTGVVGGQVEDTIRGEVVNAERVAFVLNHKTADLFVAAARIGVMASGGRQTLLDAAERYGRNFGLAFQITDDLLDADRTSPDDGISCLTIWSRNEARRRAEEHVRSAVESLRPFNGEACEALAALANRLVDRTI